MKRRLIPLVVLAAALLVASGATAAVYADGKAQDRARAAKVRQFVTLRYDMKTCGGRWAFALTSISVRWQRSSAARDVRSGHLRFGAFGTRCSGVGYSNGHNETVDPCFGCGGMPSNRTPTYTFQLNEPYIMNSGDSSVVGGNVRGVVVDAAGDVRAHLCSRVTLVNTSDCDETTRSRHVADRYAFGHGVEQYVRMKYGFRQCYDGMYAIRSIRMRWHRTVRLREVSLGRLVVDGSAGTCAEEHFRRRIERRFNPCFGCEGARKNWTPWYRFRIGWPHLGPAIADVDQLGFRLVGHVVDSDGNERRLCTKVQFLGNESCEG